MSEVTEKNRKHMLFSDWFAQVLFLVHRPLKVAGIVGMAFSSITIVAGFGHRCGRRRPLKVAGVAHSRWPASFIQGCDPTLSGNLP